MWGKGKKGFVLLFGIWFTLDLFFPNRLWEDLDMNSLAKCWEESKERGRGSDYWNQI